MIPPTSVLRGRPEPASAAGPAGRRRTPGGARAAQHRGRSKDIPLTAVVDALLLDGGEGDGYVVRSLRVPRTAACFVVGTALGVAGILGAGAIGAGAIGPVATRLRAGRANAQALALSRHGESAGAAAAQLGPCSSASAPWPPRWSGRSAAGRPGWPWSLTAGMVAATAVLLLVRRGTHSLNHPFTYDGA